MTTRLHCPQCNTPLETSGAGSTTEQRCSRCHAATPESGGTVVKDAGAAQTSTVAYDPLATLSYVSPENKPIDSACGSAGETAARLGRIGRFELQAVLGQGGFGRVFRAFDPQLQRLVALKVPRFAPDEPAQVERFLGEARAAARLRHPNLVAVFESDRAGDEYYIASEYVEGRPLSEQIRHKVPDARKAAGWVRDLARALAYAHAEKVVHRDIKPANILLDRDGRPQLTDFGLAKRVGEDATRTVDGTVMGTPAYMAPEQARGKIAEVGPLSDQYSLGVVLYELLAGRCPFEGPPHVVLGRVMHDDPPLPSRYQPRVPRDLEAICLKAMAREPARRYASAEKMADDLDRFLVGATVQARRPGVGERTGRWLWRRRQPALLVAGVAVAVLATLCLVWLYGGLTPQSPSLDPGLQADDSIPDPIAENRQKANGSAQNLREISLGLHSYASAFGFLPQPAIYARDGRPLLSWRVAILPYMNQRNLYDRFHLDESWDSPHNRELLQYMPKVYEFPGGSTPKPNRTFYQVLVGPGALFEADPARRIQLTDVRDDPGSTLLLVEAADAVEWTRPADLTAAPDRPLPRLGGLLPGGFHVCFANGKVQFLKQDIRDNGKLLRGLISRSGGEVFDLRPYEDDPYSILARPSVKETGREKSRETTAGKPLNPRQPDPAAIAFGRDTAQKQASKNNLKQLFAAMLNYADAHNTLPPPAIYSREGTPLLSWRVALLPYLQQQALYDRFKQDEPWNSPANRELIQYMPKIFGIHDVDLKDPNTTFYQLFVGPGAFEEGMKRKPYPSSIGDGLAHTLAIVEGGEPVPWTAPVDLAFAPYEPLPRLGGPFADGFHAALFDNSVTFFKKAIYTDERALRALIGWNDAEVVNLRAYRDPIIPVAPKGSSSYNGREPARRMHTQNTLKQLAIAMRNYQGTFNRLPPYAIAGKDGKPLLSWRVALLPFLSEQSLYKKFKLDEPWDSEHNQALLPLMPRVFETAGVEMEDPNRTYYQVFVGADAAFPRDLTRRVRFADVRKDPANTLLLVEAGNPVPWTKPDDLFFEVDRPLPKLVGVYADGFYGSLMDSSVRFFSAKEYEDEQKLRALIGIREQVKSNPDPR